MAGLDEKKKFYVLDKTSHVINGKATECKKEKLTIKTYRDFWRRDSMESRTEILPVSKEECEYMKNVYSLRSFFVIK